MVKKRRKKPKFRWLHKAKRWLLKLLSPQKQKQVFTSKKRRRKKRKHQQRSASIRENLASIWLLFQSPKPQRRRRKKSFSKRIRRRWLNFTNKVSQWNQQFSQPKKRKRRRKRKQYAVYVMSNQKKVD